MQVVCKCFRLSCCIASSQKTFPKLPKDLKLFINVGTCFRLGFYICSFYKPPKKFPKTFKNLPKHPQILPKASQISSHKPCKNLCKKSEQSCLQDLWKSMKNVHRRCTETYEDVQRHIEYRRHTQNDG